jgi:alpha-tubulin suppressor-like RCC1 family protein
LSAVPATDRLTWASSSTSENPGWLAGEDLYAFGSNKNLSLGFADQDDRQFPERVHIQRPDHLLHRFHQSYLERVGADVPATQDLAKIPTLVRNKPLLIRDVVLSKLHSAVLTADPVSNLYVCGVGRGGRLGLGDENTRFTYTTVQGPLADKRIVQVALGQNHTMAVDSNGCLWTWGSNAQSQLGYTLPPPPTKDQDPISTVPRQVAVLLGQERWPVGSHGRRLTLPRVPADPS